VYLNVERMILVDSDEVVSARSPGLPAHMKEQFLILPFLLRDDRQSTTTLICVMVATTRSKTGRIPIPKYDYASLKLKGEISGPLPRKRQRQLQRDRSPLCINSFDLGANLVPSSREDISGGVYDFPPVAIGHTERQSLSAIQRADRNIQDWQNIFEWHQSYLPRLVPMVKQKLEETVTARAALADNEANNSVR
jgi:hypothetical protein